MARWAPCSSPPDIPHDDCLELANAQAPQTVAEIHRAYIAAGADLIETNTFGGNRFRLAPMASRTTSATSTSEAVRLAREEREISGTTVIVAGSVGPSGRTMEPFGTLTRERGDGRVPRTDRVPAGSRGRRPRDRDDGQPDRDDLRDRRRAGLLRPADRGDDDLRRGWPHPLRSPAGRDRARTRGAGRSR